MASKKMEGVIRGDRRVVTDPSLIQVIPGFNCRSSLGDLTEFKASIKEHGVLSAVWVRPDAGNQKQPFILIAGERRLTCVKQLWDEGVRDIRIPIEIFSVDENGAEDLMAIENLERQNLSFEDEANLVSRWSNRKFSIDEIAAKVQKSRTWVEQRLTLASASPGLKAEVASGEVPLRVGVQVAASTPVEAQNDVLTKIKEQAGGKKSKMQKVADQVLGTKGRPGKKDVNRVIKQINVQTLAPQIMEGDDVRGLVISAMRFAVGDLTQEQFQAQWDKQILVIPDAPAVVVVEEPKVADTVAVEPETPAPPTRPAKPDPESDVAEEVKRAALEEADPSGEAIISKATVTSTMTVEEAAALKAIIEEGL